MITLTQEEAQVLLQIIRKTSFIPDEYEQVVRPLVMKLQTPPEPKKEEKK